jgi:DnaJ-class molecular chaperone
VITARIAMVRGPSNVATLPPLEIQALARIMDELDYYQILHLEPDASQSAVKRAYFASSRTFHPDANRHLDETLREQCIRISKRVTEAYCVLRDPRRRTAYDAQHGGEECTLRMQLAEARASHAKQDSAERQGKTPQGRQFDQKAKAALASGDLVGAINHLQMALTFEPGSELFEEQLAHARALKKQGQ